MRTLVFLLIVILMSLTGFAQSEYLSGNQNAGSIFAGAFAGPGGSGYGIGGAVTIIGHLDAGMQIQRASLLGFKQTVYVLHFGITPFRNINSKIPIGIHGDFSLAGNRVSSLFNSEDESRAHTAFSVNATYYNRSKSVLTVLMIGAGNGRGSDGRGTLMLLFGCPFRVELTKHELFVVEPVITGTVEGEMAVSMSVGIIVQ